MNEMTEALRAFEFLRPGWLLGLLAIPPLWWWLRRQRLARNVWRSAVDPHLLSHLLDGAGGHGTRRAALLPTGFALAAALAFLALAGPSWRSLSQPLWLDRMPLVIAVDMSSATNAQDVQPSRLLQARAKIARILRSRGGGQIALIAFADDAYTVSPLTDDGANIALFLDGLAPEVMPRDGSRADRAIEESVRLLERAGFPRGEILLITDRAGGGANAAAIDARSSGYRVSVLGLGSVDGARYRDRRGDAAIARLQDSALHALSVSGGGRYAAFSSSDADLRALGVLDAARLDAAVEQDRRGRAQRDEGFWLLPPLMLLALLAFRRGVLAVCLLALWLPWRVEAADLWQREDQRAHAAMSRGVEAYRRGDYAAAETAWRDLPGAEAAYNRGNALAKQGRYDEALAQYDHALQLQPGMADALENRRRVEEARRRPPPSPPKRSPPKQSPPKSSKQEDSKPNDSKQNDSKQNDSKQNESKQNDSKSSGTKPGDQSPNAQTPGDSGRDRQRQQAPKPSEQGSSEARTPRPQTDASKPNAGSSGGSKAPPSERSAPPPSKAPPAGTAGQSRPPSPDRPGATQTPKDDPEAQAREQRAIDAAQRERMERAEQAKATRDAQARAQPQPPTRASGVPREQQIANEAWLRRVPDDPGGLLRAKFKLEERRRRRDGDR